jgi:hypothetical protein
LGANGQAGFTNDIDIRTALDSPMELFFNLALNNLAYARLMFHNEKMVRWLVEKAFTHAVPQCLKRIAKALGTSNGLVDKFIYPGIRLLAFTC